MRYLKDAGLLAPEEIPSDDDRVPLDFTSLNGRQIGRVHSTFAVRHAHAIFVAARLRSDLARLRRVLRVEQAKFRIRHGDEYKNKYSVDDAMQEDDKIGEILGNIADGEAQLEVIDAVATGYEDFRNAASREMFRRSAEKAPLD